LLLAVNRGDALALLLAVGVTSGSLSGLLTVVSHLKKGPDRLPPNSSPFLSRLQNMSTPLDLSIPSEETSCGELLVKLSSDHPENDVRNRDSSFATDGTHLFIWNSIACSLHKIGTGFHGTIAGNEYLSNPHITQQLLDHLGPLAYKYKGQEDFSSAPNEVNPVVEERTTTISVISACNRIIIGEDDDVDQVLSGEVGPDDVIGMDIGTTATVLEERTVRIVEFDRDVRFFRIGEREWIGEDEPVGDDEGGGSESDEDEEQPEFVRTLDVTTVTRTADGETIVSSSIAEQEDLELAIARKAAWIACIQGKIYLRMEHILGPFRLAIFSASSLKLEDVVDLNLPIPEFIKAKKLWLKTNRAQSSDMEVEESKVDLGSELPVDPMDVVTEINDDGDDDVTDEVWEDGAIVDLIRTVLPGNETVSRPSVVAASSNFMASAGIQERNLLCEDQEFSTENYFHFASGDEEQELIVDLGTVFRVAQIGAEFETSVHEHLEIYSSVDGTNYVLYGSLTPVANVETVLITSGQILTELPEQPPPNVVQEVRYIRFKFGAHDPSGDGSVIRKLLVFGPKKVLKEVAVPFPVLTTDGHHLVFIHSASKTTEEGTESFLQTFTYLPIITSSTLASDPVVQNFSWGLDGNEKELRSCSFLHNGSILILSHTNNFAKITKEEKVKTFCYWKLNCSTGKLLASNEFTYSKNKGFPASVVYDSRNNMIWSWCWPDFQVLRWRNGGLAPRFHTQLPSDQKELLLSPSPHHRLQALYNIPETELTPNHEAAIILCQLDRLALLYSPPREPVAERKKLNELEVISAGGDDGNFCKLFVRGQSFGNCSRGFNILVLDSHFNAKDFRNFDTHDNTSASERMADFIDVITPNSIVLVGTMDSANANLTSRGKALLRSLGAANSQLEKLSSKGSYSLIGKKGASSKEVVQQLGERKNGPVSVTQRLPSPKVPLSMECSYPAIHGLVELVRDHYSLIKQDQTTSTLDVSLLITSLRLLSTNVYQLLSGCPIQKAVEIFAAEDRQIIVQIVSEMIDSPPTVEGGDIVAETALQLFITSIDVLYPTPTEKCDLLVRYLDEFVNETLSPLEGSVLGLLLLQMSDATSLSKLFRHSHSSSEATAVANPAQLLSSLLSIAKKETLLRLERLVSKEVTNHNVTNASVGNAAVQMLATLCNMILSQSVQSLMTTETSSPELAKYAQQIIDLLSTLTESSSIILDAALHANQILQANQKQAPQHEHSSSSGLPKSLDNEIDEMIKLSPVGELLPTVLNAIGLLFESHGDKLIPFVNESISQHLTRCLNVAQTIVQMIPKSKTQSSQSVIKTITQVYESAHPYLANHDEIIECSFPGALKITIVFDPETRVENNYDWVKFWKDRAKTATWHPSVDKYTGRNGSENWPGQGDRPPLVIEGNEFFVEWHTDSSNEDWGWKFTATVETRRKQTSQSHWFFDLDKQLSYCSSSVAASMIISTPWVSEKENRTCFWMEDSLLDFGFKDETDVDLSEEEIFLQDFELRPEGSKAAIVCRIMKSHVMEDQGQVDDVNRAVYSTCAALLKHNNLTKEAMALADDIRQTPSDLLLKVWRAGQKMHTFFAFRDVRDASKAEAHEHDLDELPPPPTMERGPSIYSGADAEVISKTASEVIHRAKFLLRVNSSAKFAAVTKENAKRKWGLLSQSVLSRSKSHGESDLGGKWHALVGEAQAASKLKDMFSHRRRETLRKQAGLTPSEKVLRFVQGRVHVEDLEMIRKLRNNRAVIRSQGLNMMSQIIHAAQTPFSVKWILASFSCAIRSTVRPESARSHVHYLNAIEGCSDEERVLVMKSFCNILEKCVQMMSKAYSKSLVENLSQQDRKEWKEVTISCIRAVAFDYDLIDHPLLDSSNVLSVLQTFLKSTDFDIQRTAWSLFEVLLPRCVALEGQRLPLITDEPSEFSKHLVALLISELDRAAKVVSSAATHHESPTPPPTLANGISIVKDTVALHSDSLGFTAPHQPLGLFHTFSFWMKRPTSSIEESLNFGTPKEGYRVFRGPDWKKNAIEDGGPGKFGTIEKVDGDRVSVKWDNKAHGKYKFGLVENGRSVYEVVIVDEAVSGHIFSKGMRALLVDEEESNVWSTFGVCLRGNATIEMFAACGGDEYYSSCGKTLIPPDEWTHVAIVQEKTKNKIYINGSLDSENLVLGQMLCPGKGSRDSITIESPHPYLDNTDDYTVVQEEGALSYTITFDPRTRTESNYDFIRFYKDSSHTEYWGEDKYTGGRGGSSMNWPGMEGRPPLIIPASSFVIHFKTDGSNNDWGYIMHISVEKPIKEVENEKLIEVLNDKPFYLGQTPSYVDNNKFSPRSIDGLLNGLTIYPRSLTTEEVGLLLKEKPENGTSNDEVLCLDVLTMMNRSCNSIKNTPVHVSNAFVGPSVVNYIFCLVANGTPIVQSSALKVCAALLPACPPDLVLVQAQRCGLIYNNNFLFYLFNRIGEIMNMWARYSPTDSSAVICTEHELSIGMEHLNLLNALCVSDQWQPLILEMVENFIRTVAPQVISETLNCCAEETILGKSLPTVHVPRDSLNITFSLLGLLGGSLSGLFTGASAKYSASDDAGMLEDCIILSSAWPPSEASLPKEQIPLWKDLTAFGDAYLIVLSSQPGESLLVPRSKLAVVTSPFSQKLDSFLSKLKIPLVEFFSLISNIDCVDKRPVHVPKVKESDEILEFESPHPYAASDIYVDIKMPGAKNMTIEFDRRTRTNPDSDFVRFYKDETHTAYHGAEKYHGKDGSQHWPGLNGVAPLVIPEESCVMHFHSDGSNSDWGYKFTVKAHCVVKTYPPDRPPLLHNSVIGQVKLLGMNALHTLLKEFSWFNLACVPIIPNLLTAALAPLPSAAKLSASRKPLIVESDHPYSHNLDQYTPVRIPGAKKLIVTFDEQTAVENGCDYMRIYKDDTHTEYWGENQYTGGKDGGNSNWPGMKGRPPLIIPADSFVIYYHTDGSVNAWGWLMTIKAGEASGESVRPIMDPAQCNYRASCCQFVLREFPVKYANPPSLIEFDVEKSPDDSSVLVLDISEEISHSLDVMDVVTSSTAMSPLDKRKSEFNALVTKQQRCSTWPKNFIVNAKDANEVAIRKEAQDTSEVLHVVPKGTTISAISEIGDWIQITLPADGDAAPVIGWTKRREGDQLYLLPAASSSANQDEDLITLQDEEIGNVKTKHPQFDVDESGVTQLAKREIQPTTIDVIQGAQGAIERLAVDMFQLGSICVAQDCVSEMISNWPEDIPFTLESFGNSGKLLAYIRAAYLREASDLRPGGVIGGVNTLLGSMRSRILDVIRKESEPTSESPSLCDLLMSFATKQLADSLRLETALGPVRAKVTHLESKHNYDDNMDTYTDLSVPGAKRLQLIFDKRTSIEKDCDYVIIYQDQSRTQTYGPKYTGRASSSDKVFAGIGGTPPCNIPGDSCVVHFHSDSSNNDWGYKITCYGIMEEPTEEEREKVNAERTSPNAPIPELACWLLEFLVKENHPIVTRNLYSPATIATLRRYVEIMPPQKKLFAVNLLTSMIQEVGRASLTSEAIDELLLLKSVIIDLSTKQHTQEFTINGGNSTEISQLLQALVQATIVVDSSVSLLSKDKKVKGKVLASIPEEESKEDFVESKDDMEVCQSNAEEQNGWSVDSLGRNLELTDSRMTVRRQDLIFAGYSTCFFSQPFSSNINTNHVKLNYFSESGPIVGVAGQNFDSNSQLGAFGDKFSVGWGSQKLFISTLEEPIVFGPKFQLGDIISVVLDLGKKSISFLRNQALVGLAVGPPGSGAIHELDLPEESLFLAISLGSPNDTVQWIESLPAPLAPTSSLSSLPSGMPDWFDPIRSAVMLLRSCSARELPTSVYSRDFVPMCEAKSQIVIETSHPYGGETINQEIQIPGADSLIVRFDTATEMGSRDVISLQGPLLRGQRQSFEYTGLSRGSLVSHHEETSTISVSDRVVRGPTWDWGDQDGGAGCFGEVIEVTTWKGKSNAGISVRWNDNNFVGLYRWDYEGFFDLLVVGQSENSLKPLNINGDSLSLKVFPGPDSLANSTPTVDWSGAICFNGSSSFIEMPSTESMELCGDFTVEAWVKINPAVNVEAMVIFSRQIELEKEHPQLVLHCSNVEMSPALHLSGGSITIGVWAHIAASVNGNASALFVNGTLVASSTTISGSRIGSLGAPLYVGKNSDETKHFSGHMFDIRVWNCSRTLDVIQSEKNSTRSPETPGLMSCLGTLQPPTPNVLIDATPPNIPVPAPDVVWDPDVEPNVLPAGAKFGMKCIITPKFSLNTVLNSPQFQDILLNLQSQYTVGEFRHDLALVRYVNQISRTKKMKISQILNCKWSEIAPSEEELVAMPVLRELVMLRDARLEQLEESTIEAEEKESSNPPPLANETPQIGAKFKVKSHQHELVFIVRDNGWSCSGMTEHPGGCLRGCTGFSQSTGWPRYRCDECDFDYCDLCLQRDLVSPHSLARCSSSTTLQIEKVLQPVEARFKLLQVLNKSLETTISYFDLCTVERSWSVASLLSACRGLIFEVTKTPIWEAAMTSTTGTSASPFEMRISRSRASKFSRSGQVDNEARHMIFSQVFRQMHTVPPSTLRRTDKLYNVMFAGERSQDAGGPYRESYAMMALELQSRSLPLLIRTPNGRDSVGQNREKWVLNPGATTSLHMDMFCFLGKLMGIAIRTKDYLALDIPSIIWKLLVGETPTREDLEAIDLFQMQSLEKLRNIHLQGIDAESFGYTFYETFVTVSTDSRTVELIPNGKEKDVTFDNRHHYCDLVEQYRLHEFDRQAAAVRQGLACMVPYRLLSIFTWDQLEEFVCGKPTIDIALLRSVTEYSSCSVNDQHIQFFWQAMQEFTNEERSMFIRFTWGRSRLPLTSDGFPQRFKLQSFGKSPPDSYLPISHTCFFSIELPRYSTLEIMKEKLRYAIYNCQAIDGDDTSVGMQAASMGWEE
jgi:hypothetical protein